MMEYICHQFDLKYNKYSGRIKPITALKRGNYGMIFILAAFFKAVVVHNKQVCGYVKELTTLRDYCVGTASNLAVNLSPLNSSS